MPLATMKKLDIDLEAAIALVDQKVYRSTDKHLTDLQQFIVARVCQGEKYIDIADAYGCTEGHAKDIGSLLWQLLSQAWGTKVTKGNFRRQITQQLKSEISLDASKLTINLKKLDFVGREQAIAHLKDLVNQGRRVIVLQGEGGIGKTTLGQHFLSEGFDVTLEVLMAKETAHIVSVAAVVEEWLQRDLNLDGGQELGVTLARLKRCLEKRRVGILIDNLEPALDGDGRFIISCRDYLELLRVLGNSRVQSTTIITSRDRLCEAEINLEHYRLPGLSLKAWTGYFEAQQVVATPAISEIHRTYGGNPKAMKMLCGIVQEDYDRNLELYWQENQRDPLIETDLKNLVASQFDRLQQLDPRAYKLLCRLGCYRYQDLPQIPLAGLLCLLWDVPHHPRRVIKSLRNRSLLEFAQGGYWLHPMIQAEARLRLPAPVWQQTQRQIAHFLTESVTRINNIQDGLTALEACYHYLAIVDYDAAARVILYSRENQWGQFLTLGTTLYRLGIIEPVTVAIQQIIKGIDHERHRSELNNILGDLYWTTGRVHQAIAIQRQTAAISQQRWQLIPRTQENRHDLYYWRMLEVDALLSLGLYHIDLWELETAADFLQQVVAVAHNTKHQPWSEKASLGLALINSHSSIASRPNPNVSRLYRLIIDLEDPSYNTGRWAYFMQMLGQIFLNQQQLEAAKIIWQRAIAFAESGHYTQIKAKSLIGLASLERLTSNLNQAQIYHQQAVELLEKINAKCDLAEAYLQWGLTLQANQQEKAGVAYLEQAIAIYQQIPAPKQVVRVQGMITTNS
ncbi:MAG: tetratricopeptide repeat protein [Cyanobacteria bacterium J06621_8]